MKNRTYSVIVTEENGWYVAVNPDTGVASQGKTIDQALANLREALQLYLEEMSPPLQSAPGHRSAMLTTINL